MKHKNQQKETSNRKSLIIIILLLLLLFLVSPVTIWALFFKDKTPTLAPDYALQGTEDNAESMGDTANDEKLPQQQGGGAVSLSYSKEVKIDLSERAAKIYFANPTKSNQNMMLQIVIQDTVILQSGLILPGYKVSKLDIFENIKLSPGIYEGKFVVYYYQPDTREKAMLNTEIPLTVTVTE